MTNFSIAGASAQAYTEADRGLLWASPGRERAPDTNICSAIPLALRRPQLRAAAPISRSREASGTGAGAIHPERLPPYEHMFWRASHPTTALRAVHRARDLARAALLLEPSLDDAHELVAARASHPHRAQL